MNYLFVLGADDPEMSAIESLLHESGQQFTYARGPSGPRVIPPTTYQAVMPDQVDGITDVVFIECDIATGTRVDWLQNVDLHFVDHHRPGDPGYGCGPTEFLPASSIGQVITLLAQADALPPWERSGTRVGILGNLLRFPTGWNTERWEVMATADTPLRECDTTHLGDYLYIPENLVVIAAADHCLAAAYAGQCPGVHTRSLREFRVSQRATHQRRTEAEIEADIDRAAGALEIAPRIEIGGVMLADLRGQFVPELPEAACINGIGYLATVEERDGRRKIVIGGCGEGTVPGVEPVEVFISAWAPAQGLIGIYGVPVRGIGGAYQ